MSSLEQLPIREMNEINWNKITEDQAKSFGLSLGIFNDAIEVRDKMKAVFMARLSSLVVAVIVGGVSITWGDSLATIVGIGVALSVGTLASAWQLYRKNELVDIASKDLTSDIAVLPKEH